MDRSPTESRLEETAGLDTRSVRDIVRLMNRQDATAAKVVRSQLKVIEAAVNAIVAGLAQGGRLIYVGAGTSGRLGVLDASECPPTFGTPPDLVQAVIAGGLEACWRAMEGAEDNVSDGMHQIASRHVDERDTVVGISASGRTPFVIAALREATHRKATTVSVICNGQAEMARCVQYPIVLEVGPEVLTGSTRLKSGTAQKMVLNMLSTASLVKSGRTFGNVMVGCMLTSQKLRRRALGMLAEELQIDEAAAARLLQEAADNVSVAFVMGRCGVDAVRAQKLLADHGQNIRRAVESAGPQ